YGGPGSPLMGLNESGKRVMVEHEGSIYLTGRGSGPEGDRPFLASMDLVSLETERLFRSGPESYESVIALLADDASSFLTRHESSAEPPNYYIRSQGETKRKALTQFPDPAPQLTTIKKELVTYERPDGVPLTGTLYLPTDYEEGKRYPMVIWAYPREYNSPDTAGQVRGSQHRFTTIRGPSHLFFLTQGYVVFDGAAMPVIGDPATANDTYVEQIVAAAKAAIDKAVEMGVADPNRIGIGGHSYGAFMTANLLAHSDIFKAGIARSGAYNRTLTPFGFQNERRTFWEAPETYFAMSPFMHAEKINEPILLLHGQADNNSGTFPIQSDRFFHALKGHGARVRYVSLPHESHGYRGRESVLHTLAEMIDWFDLYLKGPDEK
ncbi:S9 family peptidase, partial [Candidatus Sumerlaeota bacterium]|nr:S9 family peptidase [Candidatus Sumerlaeota bacterium]